MNFEQFEFLFTNPNLKFLNTNTQEIFEFTIIPIVGDESEEFCSALVLDSKTKTKRMIPYKIIDENSDLILELKNTRLKLINFDPNIKPYVLTFVDNTNNEIIFESINNDRRS